MSVPLVYGLMLPHRVGSICGEPCDQCGGNTGMTGPGSIGAIDAIPLFIVREASYQEYAKSCRANGAAGPLPDATGLHFYVVSTD